MTDKGEKLSAKLEKVRKNIEDTRRLIAYHKKMLKIYLRKESEIADKLEKEQLNDLFKTVKDKGKHFFLDVGAGCEYQFNGKTAVPFAELGARVKLGKVGIGAYGGYSHDTKENKGLPYARAKVTYDIIGF